MYTVICVYQHNLTVIDFERELDASVYLFNKRYTKLETRPNDFCIKKFNTLEQKINYIRYLSLEYFKKK